MGQADSRPSSSPSATGEHSLRISVVIPALNESASIAAALESVRNAVIPPVEVVVVDGGSSDDTVAQARRMGAQVIHSERGRGRQLNAGWRASRGDWCLFLHADSRLPPQYDRHMAAALQRSDVTRRGSHSSSAGLGSTGCQVSGQQASAPVGAIRAGDRCGPQERCKPDLTLPGWGAFVTIHTDLSSPLLRMILSAGVALRTHLFQRPYGDQAVFVRRDILEACDGFREWPLLEDLELVTRLAKAQPPTIVEASVFTSGRRWQSVGFWRTTVINQAILVCYALGVPPDTLAEWYRNAKHAAQRHPEHSDSRGGSTL